LQACYSSKSHESTNFPGALASILALLVKHRLGGTVSTWPAQEGIMARQGTNRRNSDRLKDLRFQVATRLLDHIGVSMYSEYPKAVGELVVNEYDADANYVTINVEHDRVVISGNGAGMHEADLRGGYMFLGSGQKRATRRTPIYHRLPIGSKGIGKLAGLGVADRMEVETSKEGWTYRFCVDRRDLQSGEKKGRLKEVALESAHIPLQRFRSTKGTASGTTVTLTRLRYGQVDPKRVLAYIARSVPIGPDFKVVVNGELCRPVHVESKKRIAVQIDDPVCGLVIGEILVAKKRLTQPGVLTTVRGRVVGAPSFFDINVASLRHNVADLVTGQVEVTGFDPEEEDDCFSVIKTDREGFVTTHPRYQAYSGVMTRLLYALFRELEREYDDKREAEKRARVDEAISQAREDLAAYDKLRHGPTGGGTTQRGRRDPDGVSLLHRRALLPQGKAEGNGEGHGNGHSPEYGDEIINATLGAGRLKFGHATYAVRQDNLGELDRECKVCKEECPPSIVVNVDHPAYNLALEERATHITVFRAIAGALAAEETASSADMYEYLDDMIRFHAQRAKERRWRKEVVVS
jgi:hypothetical protein